MLLLACSLLQQLRDLKAEAARGEFEAILSDLLRAISQSVSILDYQLHRTLITEIMNLSIWLNSKASPSFAPSLLLMTPSTSASCTGQL